MHESGTPRQSNRFRANKEVSDHRNPAVVRLFFWPLPTLRRRAGGPEEDDHLRCGRRTMRRVLPSNFSSLPGKLPRDVGPSDDQFQLDFDYDYYYYYYYYY